MRIADTRGPKWAVVAASVALIAGCAKQPDSVSQAEKKDEINGVPVPSIAETKAIAEEAYVYGFAMIAGYKAMYEFNIDKSSSQFKAPFNQIANEARVFTYKDTAIVTPNSDTPYGLVQMDLRAEPMVLCVPAVEKKRYYSIMLTDLYTDNYGYIGSRATGNDAGCFVIAGPDWKGATPPGIKKVFNVETQFSLGIYRTQLFNPADMDNVKKIQAAYVAEPLSAFLKQPPPPAAPAIDFPPFTADDPFKTDFVKYLDFLLQFAPAVAEDKELRARYASIGIGPGKKFNFSELSVEHKAAVALAVKDGFEKVENASRSIGKESNG